MLSHLTHVYLWQRLDQAVKLDSVVWQHIEQAQLFGLPLVDHKWLEHHWMCGLNAWADEFHGAQTVSADPVMFPSLALQRLDEKKPSHVMKFDAADVTSYIYTGWIPLVSCSNNILKEPPIKMSVLDTNWQNQREEDQYSTVELSQHISL